MTSPYNRYQAPASDPRETVQPVPVLAWGLPHRDLDPDDAGAAWEVTRGKGLCVGRLFTIPMSYRQLSPR